ncbi:hypothetical protein PLESTM_000942700 [Pleodorina starrii]|nr:hypothetical protein PLESTM_000942700 [Pleodorina starrii]
MFCRLLPQELACGSAASDADFVVERQMQGVKSATGRGVSRWPDRHFAEVECLRRAQHNVLNHAGAAGAVLHPLDVMIAKHKQAGPLPQRLKLVEPEDSDLVGKVRPLLGDSGRAQEVMTAFQRLAADQAFNNESVRSWTDGHEPFTLCDEAIIPLTDPSSKDAIGDGPVAMIATRADLNGDVLFSAAYRRQSSRVSHWVITAWNGLNDQLVPYIGMIKYFVEMPAMLKNSGEYTTPLTLAIMDLFKGSFVADEGVVEVDMERATNRRQAPGVWRWPLFAVPLEMIDGKVIMAAPSGILRGKMYFMRYYSTTIH